MSNVFMQNPLDSEALTTNDIILVPKKGVINSRSHAEIKPFIYSAPMDMVSSPDLVKEMLRLDHFPIISRFNKEEDVLASILAHDAYDKLPFIAMGFNEAKHISALNCKASYALDIAHGDMNRAYQVTRRLSNYAGVKHIMSGSICTPEGAIRALESGCTHIRIGVGPGAACTTRLMTGCGFPQLSAVYLIYRAVQKHYGSDAIGKDIHLIADGGIKNPGDAVKYLAAGATGVMMGSAFSKCIESPGWQEPTAFDRLRGITQPMKTYRGQASSAFQHSMFGKANACPEGATSKPFRWNGDTVESVIKKYEGGVRSAISYLGLTRIEQLCPENVTFVKVTSSGYHEGTPHGV